jgi:hypothetical protein
MSKNKIIKSLFTIKNTTINFTDTAVAITTGGRFIAQSFKFPDGSDGSIVIIKKTGKKKWNPDINHVTINYENTTSNK